MVRRSSALAPSPASWVEERTPSTSRAYSSELAGRGLDLLAAQLLELALGVADARHQGARRAP